ncbi:HWE histidine kinase domain-containing protein [Aureimonas mangrovi]|uniref:HWE histidine kinase domain-containing protein n=1 Tax=Aureimonas mangrovi TaxID=2758041 RepID=UPI001FE4DE22|nr:HWE histidine kinase domain-containing protein [Aureimonas mangrovi]
MNEDDPTQFQVDLTNCDREPIHLLGRIQDVGFLLVVSMDWLIERASANVERFIGRSAKDLLGEPLTSILPQNSVHAIRGRLQVLASNEGSERVFGLDLMGDGRRFDVAVHISGGSVVIEAEPATSEGEVNQGSLVKSMITRVQKAPDLQTLYREAVRQLRGVTGFDRVMLYQFAESGSGHVIAESARSGIGSFLGLHYPASDIPIQARALYVRNQIRSIFDVDGTAADILPSLDPHGKPLDLSLSVMRAVSPIHLEYLRNMGVGASMSVSIVIDGKLWGLFALHHYAARHLPLDLRSAVELFGQMVSLIIEGRLYKERRQAEELARTMHDRFVARIVAATPSVEAIADFSEELREIIPSDGFAVYAKGQLRAFGTCPSFEEVEALSRFLNRTGASRVYANSELGAVHQPALDYLEKVAGVLAIPVSRAPRDYILFFRQEMIRTVSWAGDPHTKETGFGPNGARLTPRKSFETWQETVRGRSVEWNESEKQAAEALRVSILEVLLRFNEESERQQALANQRQELLIAELNHRVRNVLSLIRALIVQSKPGASDVDDFARIIGGRIQALARAHDQITRENFAAVPLTEIIETEVSAYIGPKASRVRVSGPPVRVEARAFSTLALVLHELVTNSAKYGALSDSSGAVDITWRVDENENCAIEWRESDGPPVQAPTRRGFGSTIIERSIPHDLGGEARVDYRLSGLEARFTLPAGTFHVPAKAVAHHIAPAGGPMAPAPFAPGALDGLNGLIVEDNMIISLDAEQVMDDNGMANVFVAASIAEARKVIEAQAVDVAVLDVNLGTETSFALLPDLNAKGVPYVFVTGYGEHIDFPPAAGRVVAIRKPFAADELLAAIATVARGKTS